MWFLKKAKIDAAKFEEVYKDITRSNAEGHLGGSAEEYHCAYCGRLLCRFINDGYDWTAIEITCPKCKNKNYF